MNKYCFRNDDDGHWYMIPVEKSKLFSELLSRSGEQCDYRNFCNEFDRYYIDSPKHFVFENPEEV